MSRLLAYFQLCRFAAVFTALADIFLGYALAHRTLQADPQLGWLLLASAGLYLSGMVFNDVFDRKIDAAERPKRPIPSGRVSLQSAIVLGSVLLLAGLTAAAMAGLASLMIAVVLVVLILAYDGGLKKNIILGPLCMGGCRLFNVLLGVSAAANLLLSKEEWVPRIFSMPQLLAAGGLATYIFGVTWFARNEAGLSRRSQLWIGIAFIDLGLALLASLVLFWRHPDFADTGWRAAIILGFIAFNLNRRLIDVVGSPSSAQVQTGVRTLLLSIITIDAAIVFFMTGDFVHAAGVLCLLIPAILMGKALAIT
jgi:4-hydroxybenzoate polyprenyltransferase